MNTSAESDSAGEVAPPPDVHAWQIQARTRINWLRAEVEQAQRTIPGGSGPRAEVFDEVVRNLAQAEGWLRQKPGLSRWMRGTRVEGAWSCIHSAHARLLEVASEDQVRGLIPGVAGAIAAYLPEKDPERKKAEAWIAKNTAARPIEAVDRELLSNTLRHAYDANAERYTQLRRFRNILGGAALAALVLAAMLGFVGFTEPTALPLCFSETAAADDADDTDDDAGDDTDAGDTDDDAGDDTDDDGEDADADAEEDEEQVCPSGGDRPSSGDAPLVALLGLAGGLIGGLTSLTRSSRATVSSYTLRVARAALKVFLGGVTAVLGLVLLRAGFAPGFEGLDSQHEILGYAFVFGASQQLLTRIADQQGEAILKSASSENEGGTAAEASE